MPLAKKGGRPANTPPHIRLNSGGTNPFADRTGPPTPGAPQSPVSIPQPLYSPSFKRPSSSHNDSSEHLALPTSSHRFPSPHSNASSRRSSWSSDGASQDSRHYGHFGDDSQGPSRTGSEEDINTQTVMEKYAIMPDSDLLVFPEDVEKDDYLHNPDPNDKDGRDCNMCNKRGLMNGGGLLLLVLGVMTLFVIYPIINFVHNSGDPEAAGCEADPMCLNVEDVPLLKNVRTTLVDPDTPESAKTIKAANGKEWKLVYSDEFNKDGRTFFNGDDPYLQAVDIWYGVTEDLEWYDPDAVTTKDGKLELRFDAFQNHGLNYRSGMVQSWNQLCFTGGRLEASISLPGRGDTSGFWPGFWSMGNLGRPGYAATTEGMWPYSYDDICDAGITPNQSSTDGISFLPGMKLPACTCKGEDHPTPGKSRSAPEIDVIEASSHSLDPKVPSMIGDVSQSCQIAPFDIWYMPDYEFTELYDPRITSINGYRGGPYQQAISGLTNLNNKWYDGNEYQEYAFEYEPGREGYVTWFVGQEKTWKLDGRALGPNGNIGHRTIPMEPMALIMNFGMSHSFTGVNITGLAKLMPAIMRFDYVRIYQDPDMESVTCDPPGHETTEYIRDHPEPYANPNLTRWQATDYEWPKNSYMHDCK
ncbi:hypothetical protein AJ80_05795 [Polytolypa hystricis UAMH7299]|uniref:GH16 domain-containing protein n=1 Tax=Polytolypa hystricis (strain UAMH7299) TaxID=1447883 RepID=A0A2B7Y137_POLH7|nr:hypothetical protein AJ80_05795 [Polytolypa hystricis UAMH7299]